ncbi:acetyltransferase, partial [Staphylococcus aureus]
MNNFFNVYFEYKGVTVNIVSSTIHTHGVGKSLKGSHVSLIIPIDG